MELEYMGDCQTISRSIQFMVFHFPPGFGFVTFQSEEPAEKVCSIQYHDIKGKKVEVKVAQTKEALAMQQGRKIFNQRNYSKCCCP